MDVKEEEELGKEGGRKWEEGKEELEEQERLESQRAWHLSFRVTGLRYKGQRWVPGLPQGGSLQRRMGMWETIVGTLMI